MYKWSIVHSLEKNDENIKEKLVSFHFAYLLPALSIPIAALLLLMLLSRSQIDEDKLFFSLTYLFHASLH